MNKYSDIEIQTAQNLLKEGYKWIARGYYGVLFAYESKPIEDYEPKTVCNYYVPIFESIKRDDKEPVSLENIVHPQILDDVEKRYLSAVIRPFRDRVWYIMKSFAVDKANCYIFIRFNDGSSDMDFPVFRKGDMYKDMKMGKAYSLEELGI